ncbi:MAG: hypothetical protein M0P33_03940 [Massilibacteroides sp.]|nr:hypothetical protein [Massilibacteroides sp.]
MPPHGIPQSEQVILSLLIERAVDADGKLSFQPLEAVAIRILFGRAFPRRYHIWKVLSFGYYNC